MCNICCNGEERIWTFINWLMWFIIMIDCTRVCVQIVWNVRLFWYIFRVLVLKVTMCIQMLLYVDIEMILTRTHLNAQSYNHVHVYKHCWKIWFGYNLLRLNCFTHIWSLFSWWRLVLHVFHIFKRNLLNKINNFSDFVFMHMVYFCYFIFWVHNNMVTFVQTWQDSFLETFKFSRCVGDGNIVICNFRNKCIETILLWKRFKWKCAFRHVFVLSWRIVII